jgi:hypothetical protein
MFKPGIRPGLLSSAIICFLVIDYIRKRKVFIKSWIDAVVVLYIIYNIFSILWYFVSGASMLIFVREFSNSMLPAFFYFFGVRDDFSNKRFYSNTLRALVFSFFVGFVLFIQLPYFYRFYLSTIDGIGGTDPVLLEVFYRSIFGLTITSSLSAIGILLSYDKIYSNKGKKGKIELIICIVALVLTFRRSGLYVGIVSILILNYLSFMKYNLLKYRYLFLEVLAVIVAILLLNRSYPDFLPIIIDRISMLEDAFQRQESWKSGIKNMNNHLFGDGLGIYGHKAVNESVNIIPDGNYFRMYAEIGIFGLLLFLSIIFSSLSKGFKNIRRNYLELGIILTISIQAIGSDVFSFMLISPLLWYSVGRLQQHYNRNSIEELL